MLNFEKENTFSSSQKLFCLFELDLFLANLKLDILTYASHLFGCVYQLKRKKGDRHCVYWLGFFVFHLHKSFVVCPTRPEINYKQNAICREEYVDHSTIYFCKLIISVFFNYVPFSACMSNNVNHVSNIIFTKYQPWITTSLKGITASWTETC